MMRVDCQLVIGVPQKSLEAARNWAQRVADQLGEGDNHNFTTGVISEPELAWGREILFPDREIFSPLQSVEVSAVRWYSYSPDIVLKSGESFLALLLVDLVIL